MTPDERIEAERKKAAKKASKGIIEGADAPELSESAEALPEEPAIKPKRGRKAK